MVSCLDHIGQNYISTGDRCYKDYICEIALLSKPVLDKTIRVVARVNIQGTIVTTRRIDRQQPAYATYRLLNE
jgi:hypothetical protein